MGRACGCAGGSRAKAMTKLCYSGYRFPPEIIQQAIWLYVQFTLSFRDVEDLLAERGILVSYESVRRWVNPRENSRAPTPITGHAPNGQRRVGIGNRACWTARSLDRLTPYHLPPWSFMQINCPSAV